VALSRFIKGDMGLRTATGATGLGVALAGQEPFDRSPQNRTDVY